MARDAAGMFGTPLPWPVFLGSCVNMGCVVGVVVMNKYLYIEHSFNPVILLSFCHLAFTAFAMRAACACGIFRYEHCARASAAPVAAGSSAAVACMNLNLRYNSVSYFQLSKLACVPTTLAFAFFFRGERVSVPTLATLAPLVAGMALAERFDASATPAGAAYAGVAVLATVVAQNLVSRTQRTLGCDSNQLLYHTAPLAAGVLLLLCPIVDGYGVLFDVVWTPRLRRDVAVSCGLALGSNVTNYYVLGRTSPLTYQVIGHLKAILTILFSLAFLGAKATTFDARNVAGVLLAMFGVAAYTEVKRRDAVRSANRERRRIRDAPAPPPGGPLLASPRSNAAERARSTSMDGGSMVV